MLTVKKAYIMYILNILLRDMYIIYSSFLASCHISMGHYEALLNGYYWYEMIHICDCGCVIGVEIHEVYVGSIVMDGRRKYE